MPPCTQDQKKKQNNNNKARLSLTQRRDTEARDALGFARHTDNAGPWLSLETAGDSRLTETELAQGPQRAERPRGPCGETVAGVDGDCPARGQGRLVAGPAPPD